MKASYVISRIFLLCLLLVVSGCDSVSTVQQLPEVDNRFDQLSVHTDYAPVKVEVMPLTEFTIAGDDEQTPKINVYVSLLDSFGSEVKAPGVFRFELYERVFRSSNRKGGRIDIWPDIDLTRPAENNHHWRDFLRAYQFGLDFAAARQDYILQVTYLSPDRRRLCAEFELKSTE